MTNYEKYKVRIKEIVESGNDLAARNGEPGICRQGNPDCDCCDFNKAGENCSLTTLQWLLEDDGTPSAERLAGQREAWELARKIIMSESRGGYNGKQINEIFKNYWNANDIMFDHTYAEAAEKVKAWEDGKVINPGDVVTNKEDGRIGVVVGCNNLICDVLTKSGYMVLWNTYDCTKTGRTLPVSDWLRQIGGRENEAED